MQKDWVDIVNKKTAKSEFKLPCAYAFRYNRVYKTDPKIFFMFEGRCTDCGTYIHGKCDRNFSIESANVEITISTFNTKNLPHKKKRYLARTQRIEAQKILLHQRPGDFKRDRVLKEMDYGDAEPHDLNSTTVIRKARQDIRDKDLGLEGPKDVFESLEYFKNLGLGIGHINENPVSVPYNPDEQLQLWEEIMRTSEMTNQRVVAIIDSTGGLFFPVDIAGLKSGYICLHQMVTSIPCYKKPIPVTQLASERQDVNKIESWLNTVFDERIIPKEVVIDGSLTLANAVSLAFNKCNYKL